MSIKSKLYADLSRQYHYAGRDDVSPSLWKLLLNLGNPRFLPVALFRISNACYLHHLRPIAKLFSIVNFVLFGIEIAICCEIDEGLYFPHSQGTVIGALKIGKNAVIYHGVTIGAKEMDLGYSEEKRPIIGDNVIVGSGAKVLGGISLGDNSKIGANAVVLESVPSGCVAAGIPARVVKSGGG